MVRQGAPKMYGTKFDTEDMGPCASHKEIRISKHEIRNNIKIPMTKIQNTENCFEHLELRN